MITVLCEQVIRSTLKFVGCLTDDRVDLGLRRKCETVQDLSLESASGGFGLGCRPIYTCQSRLIVTSISIFFPVYDDSGMQK